MSATHNSGATPTVVPSTAPKASSNDASMASSKPPGDTKYPEQIHAGAVGYGPNYHAGPTLAEKVQGLKEELKGKITHNPDLVQHGREVRTGEEKRKKLTGEDEPNPFTAAKDDDSSSKDNAKETSQTQSSDHDQARHQSHPKQPATTDTQHPSHQSHTGTDAPAGLNGPMGLRDGKIQTMAGSPDLAPTTESHQPSHHSNNTGTDAPSGLNGPMGIRDGKVQTIAGSAGSVPQVLHTQNQTPAFDTTQQHSQSHSHSHGNIESGLNGPIGMRDGKIQTVAGPVDSSTPQMHGSGIQSDRGISVQQPYQTETFGKGATDFNQDQNMNSGSVPGIREGKVQMLDDTHHHDQSQSHSHSQFQSTDSPHAHFQSQSQLPSAPAPTPQSQSQFGSDTYAGLGGINTQQAPKANPFGMAVNQGHGKGAMEQAATVAPEGTDEAEKQRKGNNVDFMMNRPVEPRQ